MLSSKNINWLIVFTIFATALVLFKSPFEFYLFYIPMLILLPMFIAKLPLDKNIIFIFLVLGISSLISVFLNNNTFPIFLKTYISIVFVYIFYYYALAYNQFKVEELFNLYLKFSWVIVLIGVFQFFSHKIGFTLGYNFKWFLNKWTIVANESSIRVNSIISEPSQLAFVLCPAIFISVYNLLNKTPLFFNKFRSLVILVVAFLTLSTHAYIIVILSVLFIMLRRISFLNAVVILTVMYIAFGFIYQNFPVVRVRVDDSLLILTDFGRISDPYFLASLNSSSFTLLNNYIVAIKSFEASPIIGNGFGSHVISFDKYSFTNTFYLPFEEFNKSDANSLLLRLISETGILGVSIFLYILIKFRCPKNVQTYRWLISNGILVMMIAGLLREGHYFHSGVPFFIFIYIYNYKQAKKESLKLT